MGFSANGFDEGSQEIPVNTGTAVAVADGRGLLDGRVAVGPSFFGLGVASELQPMSKTRIANDETWLMFTLLFSEKLPNGLRYPLVGGTR